MAWMMNGLAINFNWKSLWPGFDFFLEYPLEWKLGFEDGSIYKLKLEIRSMIMVEFRFVCDNGSSGEEFYSGD